MQSPSKRFVGLTILSLLLFLGSGFALSTTSASIFLPENNNQAYGISWLGIAAPEPIVVDATINTDRDDYSPGQIVVISGAGWAPNESVKLEVDYKENLQSRSAVLVDVPHGHDPWFVVADDQGRVSSSWLVEDDSAGRTLLLKADGLASGSHAEKVF